MWITPGETETSARADPEAPAETEPAAAGRAATELEKTGPVPATTTAAAVSPHVPTAITISLGIRTDDRLQAR
jgi:hypothetical protein